MRAPPGHVTPEAQEGGPIALVKDGDVISIDSEKSTIELEVAPEEMETRRRAFVAKPLRVKNGALYKYVKCVKSASEGCVTDE